MMTSLQKQKKLYEERFKDIGISIRSYIGIGDAIQFSSLPENFYRVTGEKLIDISEPWFFKYNPYVIRGVQPKKTIELWNYPKQYDWIPPRKSVYCCLFGIEPKLIRPRLYQFEDYPFYKRDKILFHPFGKSHGSLPSKVINAILTKYESSPNFFQIGLPSDPALTKQKLETPTLWDLAKVISESRMFIGVDSGPSWIAACYPDVIVKKIRTTFQQGYCEPKDWVPLDVNNAHSFWDDRAFQIYNTFEEDIGFSQSYLKL
jgi:hypothetical protein